MLNYQNFNKFQKLSFLPRMLVMELKQFKRNNSFIQRLQLFLKDIEENIKPQNVTIWVVNIKEPYRYSKD